MSFKKLFLLLSILIFTVCLTDFGGLVALADDIVTDIPEEQLVTLRLPESNGMATVLCFFVDLMRSDIAKVLTATSLFSAGVGAFFGKLTLGWFLSFAIGVAVYFGSISVLGFIAPYSGIDRGCECKRYAITGRNYDGSYVKIDTRLQKNCQLMN